jgi:xylulokinase
LLAQAFEESRLLYPRPGWVEQNPEDFYTSSSRTIRECVQKSRVDPADVAAIAFDGQMAGIGAVDAEWGAPTPYDSWLDTRCKPYIAAMKPLEDRIIRTTGGPPSFNHGPKILWWKNERPETFRQIAKFVVPVTYAAGYARVDLSFWRTINRYMTAYVNVGNMLNRHYEEVAGYPALRANFRAGMRFRLGGE